ncbi:hypothetical protein DFP72DRAFT_850634 [Ephemerocybe angulata]|uniref:Uncharacterized protein n=1 Tax=Ephemerocybe angulata TaxID=980116 RepID=A0A8H6M4T9_9AGAR|nr:hypothetical protein DFP72DRAFT_850634 [Tulosesus angulatus]
MSRYTSSSQMYQRRHGQVQQDGSGDIGTYLHPSHDIPPPSPVYNADTERTARKTDVYSFKFYWHICSNKPTPFLYAVVFLPLGLFPAYYASAVVSRLPPLGALPRILRIRLQIQDVTEAKDINGHRHHSILPPAITLPFTVYSQGERSLRTSFSASNLNQPRGQNSNPRAAPFRPNATYDSSLTPPCAYNPRAARSCTDLRAYPSVNLPEGDTKKKRGGLQRLIDTFTGRSTGRSRSRSPSRSPSGFAEPEVVPVPPSAPSPWHPRPLHQMEECELESMVDAALRELTHRRQSQANSSGVSPSTGAATQPPPPGTSTPSISGSQSQPPVHAPSMYSQGSQQISQGAGAGLDLSPLYQAISDRIFNGVNALPPPTQAIPQMAVTPSIVVPTHPTGATPAPSPAPHSPTAPPAFAPPAFAPPAFAPPAAATPAPPPAPPPAAAPPAVTPPIGPGNLAQWSTGVPQNQGPYLLPAPPYSMEAQPEETSITVTTQVGETLGYP